MSTHSRHRPADDTAPAVRFGPSTLHGRGVFACRDFAPGDVIECCAVLLLPVTEYEVAASLHGYIWCADDDVVALALGCGSLYNHADDAAASAELDVDTATLTVTARRTVHAGEEITVNYGAEYWLADEPSS